MNANEPTQVDDGAEPGIVAGSEVLNSFCWPIRLCSILGWEAGTSNFWMPQMDEVR